MEETKLIKLLDLALERIDQLEIEAISTEVMTDEELRKALDRTTADVRELLEENGAFRRTIEELKRENRKLDNYFFKANAEACELTEENELLKTSIEEKDAAIFELQQSLEKVSKQRNELVLETANAGEVAQIKKENEKLSNMIRMLKTDKGILEDKLKDIVMNSGESSPAKWNDILDATKRPRPNEQVLFTTQSGRVLIGSMDEGGKIHNAGKPVKVTAWMKLPKPFTK